MIISAIVVCYSIAIFLQGYVEQKITILERIVYGIIAAVAITPNIVFSLIAAAMFMCLYWFRKLQVKSEQRI